MTGINGVSNTAYIQDAMKYINGMPISNPKIQDDVIGAFSGVPSFTLMQGGLFAGGQIFKKNPVFENGAAVLNDAGEQTYKMGGFKGLWHTLKDLKTYMVKNQDLTALLKANKGLKGADANLQATKEIKDLIKMGKSAEVDTLLKSANSTDDIIKGASSIKEAANAASQGAAKTSKLAKVGKFISNLKPVKAITGSKAVTGIKSALEAFAKTPVGGVLKSGAGKFSKAFKGSGAGICLAFEGIAALFTDVMPAFKLGGVGEGLKQTGKSALKVGASTAGFVAGGKAGAAVGSLIGGFICPGLGNVIGGVVGDLVGGLIGSAVAGKVADKVVGPDFTDKLQEEQIAEQAPYIAQDQASMQQVNMAVEQMIQQDMADDGKLTEDSEKMLAYLQAGAGETQTAYNPYQTTYNPYQTQTGYPQYNQPAYTDQTQTQTQTQTVNTSELDELIRRVQSGDRSVYDVPQEVLSQSAGSLNAQYEGYANNYTNYGYQNPYATTNMQNGQMLNFYGA